MCLNSVLSAKAALYICIPWIPFSVGGSLNPLLHSVSLFAPPSARYFLSDLRLVPTKYKVFCVRLGPCGKSRSLQGLLVSPNKNWGSHAFFRDN